MPALKNHRQEIFCQKYVELGNQTQAYIEAGYKANGANAKAPRLIANDRVSARIKELKAEHKEKHKITVDDIINQLTENRLMAIDLGQISAANQATLGVARVLGLEKNQLDVTNSDRTLTPKINLTNEQVAIITKKLDDEY